MKRCILQDMTQVFTETAFIPWAFTVFWENLVLNYSLVKPAIQLFFPWRWKLPKTFTMKTVIIFPGKREEIPGNLTVLMCNLKRRLHLAPTEKSPTPNKPRSCGIGDWLKAGWELDSDWLPGGCGGIWLPVTHREKRENTLVFSISVHKPKHCCIFQPLNIKESASCKR